MNSCALACGTLKLVLSHCVLLPVYFAALDACHEQRKKSRAAAALVYVSEIWQL